MKKLCTIFTTTLLLTALVVSCGKETQSSTQGGGLFKVRVTITPPLQAGLNSNSIGNYFSIGSTTVTGGTTWLGNSQTLPLSTWESQEYSVTKGQNFGWSIQLNNSYDVQCRQVKIEGLTDNKVFKTYNLELGVQSLNPIVQCKDVGIGIINFIIP